MITSKESNTGYVRSSSSESESCDSLEMFHNSQEFQDKEHKLSNGICDINTTDAAKTQSKLAFEERKRLFDGTPMMQTPRSSTRGIIKQECSSSREIVQEGIQILLKQEKEPILISILYGILNIAIVLPVIMSFGTIIYKDAAFAPYLPVLVKLTVFSGVVHQLCITSLSSLPFAIGQVQDAGLIFLSSMASTIVVHCRTHYDAEEYDVDEIILATTTILLSICTAILGLGVILIAKARLASYIQMLPKPVVGGYLAFIGFFCGQAGMSLTANVQVNGLLDWPKFVSSHETFIHLLPGLLGGISIYLLVNRIGHMFVLPACILALLGVFYAVLALTGTSVEEAQQSGWVNPSDPPPAWNHTWDYLQFDKVAWSVFPKLIMTLIGMIAVVAPSSSLDILAIETDMGYPLDINKELQTVGISNLVSGLAGGYTGSYIFSQSIFSFRAGIRRRVNGLVVAICEIIVILVPFSPLNYVPSFVFGSMLVMIAVDLMTEWLWKSRHKTTLVGYVICLVTFGLIQCLGVEYGLIAGLAVYAACSKFGLNVSTLVVSNDDSSPKRHASDVSNADEYQELCGTRVGLPSYV